MQCFEEACKFMVNFSFFGEAFPLGGKYCNDKIILPSGFNALLLKSSNRFLIPFSRPFDLNKQPSFFIFIENGIVEVSFRKALGCYQWSIEEETLP